MTTPQENLIRILTGAKVEPPKKNAIYEALMQCEKRGEIKWSLKDGLYHAIRATERALESTRPPLPIPTYRPATETTVDAISEARECERDFDVTEQMRKRAFHDVVERLPYIEEGAPISESAWESLATSMNVDRSATVMDMASKMRYIPDPAEFPITLTVMLDMQPFDNAMDAFIRRLQEEQRKLQEPSTTEPNP